MEDTGVFQFIGNIVAWLSLMAIDAAAPVKALDVLHAANNASVVISRAGWSLLSLDSSAFPYAYSVVRDYI